MPQQLPERFRKKIKSNFWHQAMQSAHMERALRTGNPNFVRLADLAVALAEANGHARFGVGELTRLLGVADARPVDRAIADGIKYGLLAAGSTRRCLQVPGGLFLMYAGAGDDAAKQRRRDTPCPTCHPDDVSQPATCHPDRQRRTSAASGSLCEPCYRRNLRAKRKGAMQEHRQPVRHPDDHQRGDGERHNENREDDGYLAAVVNGDCPLDLAG